jgi:predicted nucleic acid-binding protein
LSGRKPDARVIRWLTAATPESLFASVVNFGEIRLGIEDLPLGLRRTAQEEWLDRGLPAWFESNPVPVTQTIADRWGRLTIEAKKKGMSIATADGLIAATALEHDLAILTRNVKDFAKTGTLLVNPWELWD